MCPVLYAVTLLHAHRSPCTGAQGTMGQMLVWLSFAEIFGTAATIQMLQVSLSRTQSFLLSLSLTPSIYIYTYTYIHIAATMQLLQVCALLTARKGVGVASI